MAVGRVRRTVERESRVGGKGATPRSAPIRRTPRSPPGRRHPDRCRFAPDERGGADDEVEADRTDRSQTVPACAPRCRAGGQDDSRAHVGVPGERRTNRDSGLRKFLSAFQIRAGRPESEDGCAGVASREVRAALQARQEAARACQPAISILTGAGIGIGWRWWSRSELIRAQTLDGRPPWIRMVGWLLGQPPT